MTKLRIAEIALLVACLLGCARQPVPVEELKGYAADSLDGLVTRDGVAVDEAVTSDGNGALRLTATKPTTFRLCETGDVDAEDARLMYSARMRAEGLEGKAYLDMWCCFEGKGEFFARDLQTPLTGTADWSSEETPFFLQEGQNPDNVKLNLVIDGKGTVWIDDIRLLKGPLK